MSADDRTDAVSALLSKAESAHGVYETVLHGVYELPRRRSATGGRHQHRS